MSYWLYRFFAVEGELLYVGITDDLDRRSREHKQNSSWFSRVVDASVVRYPNRVAAAAAEHAVVAMECPIFNRVFQREGRELQVMLVRERLKQR
jgi:predicted GIY-YIG superfamily endonuclease